MYDLPPCNMDKNFELVVVMKILASDVRKPKAR